MNQKTSKRKKRFSRRKFLKVSGIVLGGSTALIYFNKTPLRRYATAMIADMDLPSGVDQFEPLVWFEVLPDNTILMKAPKAEMGQGIFTGFAMLAAHELEVPVDQIKVVPGSTANGPLDELGTGGSTTTSSLFEPIREVAATMREMLKTAAAKKWGTKAAQIKTRNGLLTFGNKKMTFAELVKDTPSWDIPSTPALKPLKGSHTIGKEIKRVDLAPKVLGESIYGIDAELPDMLYASILNSPYINGKLKNAEISEAKKVSGVIKVIQEKDLVAVVAKNRFAAEMGKRKIKADWTVPTHWQQKDIENIVTVGKGNAVNMQKKGSVRSSFKEAQEQNEPLVQAEYRTPLGAHAHLEPNGVVAQVSKDKEGKEKALILMGTQAPKTVRDQVADALNISTKNVEIRNSFLGGGFGRRYFKHNAVEAARIAKIMGKPVHVFTDREDEFMNGYFRPNTHHVLKARPGKNGTINALEHQLASGDMVLSHSMPFLKPILGADIISAGHGGRIFYDIENRYATIWDVKMPFMIGIWRGVGMFANTFVNESFFDEVAHQMKVDPLKLRLRHLTSKGSLVQRMRKALEAVQEKSGWDKPKPKNVGRGVACGEDRKSIAVAAVEVQEVDGKIRVTKVTEAIDPGVIVNPEGVRMQVEGCIMMGISASLYEGIYVKDGQFTVSNYHQYPMATLVDTPPAIEVILLENDEKPYGVGEPPIAPIAPAIANAIFDLTGKRLRSLPLQKALEAAKGQKA